jgi:hypothetical protein
VSSRPRAFAQGPEPILRSLSIGHGVWVPAFAGTTLCAYTTTVSFFAARVTPV